ncbi:unnamed protein product [Paramecium octaurelia]|uniref:Uncharacterized protein n=1 Tax=Paramecium octaurelia TaxID=43137 RepID=A0A8S1V2F9_PAROT|nr:unnamed protein product [Paramecium octaurelia]
MNNSQQSYETIKQQILSHLNSTCTFGQVFALNSSEDFRFELPVDHNLQLNHLLARLKHAFQKLCAIQIKQIIGITIPNAFKLQMSFDAVMKKALAIPFKALFKDKLILSPLFCDISVIVQQISISENPYVEIQRIDADEFYVILLFWQIRQLLIREHQNKATFEIFLYPKQHNFGISKIENNKETIYFHSMDHKLQFLIQNSLFHTTISKAIQQNKLKEFQVQLFEKNDENLQEFYNAEIHDQLVTIQNSFNNKIQHHPKNNINLKIKYENRIKLTEWIFRQLGVIYYKEFEIFEQNNNYPKLRYEYLFLFKNFHIKNPINYYQSTLCLRDDDWENNFKHFIKLDSNDNPKCECGRQFDPSDCDTFIIDSQINKKFSQITQELIPTIENSVLTALISQPIFVQIETRKYGNQFFVLYHQKKDKDNTIKKEKLMEYLFQGMMLNYDVDQIKDRVERSLLEQNNEDYDSQKNNQSAGLNQVINDQKLQEECKLQQK